jgi:uncharacterized protein involved in exopolysaccharide biosynthesis
MTSPRPEPDLDAEAEVDLGRFARAVLERWWLLLAGVVAGAIIGYLTTLGGGQYYRASAVVYLGQPLGALSASPVQALNTNPSAVRAIVTSESVVQRVARRSGLSPGRLRSGVSVNVIAGAQSKFGQTPLTQVTVKGPEPAKVRVAANALAAIVVSKLIGPARGKIAIFKPLRDADQSTIDAVNRALSEPGLDLTEKLLLQTRLQAAQSDLAQVSQQLSSAEEVEAPRVVTEAASAKTAVRNHRNATAVGAFIGLILGGLAAVLWEPLTRLRRSEP